MTTYDKKTDTWTAVHDLYTNIQVSGPTREGVEQRLAELASRRSCLFRPAPCRRNHPAYKGAPTFFFYAQRLWRSQARRQSYRVAIFWAI